MGTAKAHTTAVVIIPPEDRWEPIQRVRRVHDRQVHRWMPHVTMLYPFVPRPELDEATEALRPAAATVEPFEVVLRRFRWFEHRKERYTLWLEPEPVERVRALHAALLARMPEFDATSRFPGGFTPHLSVGQVRGRGRLDTLVSDLEVSWEPVRFTLDRVAVLRRGRETPFEVHAWLHLDAVEADSGP